MRFHLFKGEREMDIRRLRSGTSLIILVTAVLIAGRCWAVHHPLGPSKNEWGLKYDLQVTAADGERLSVVFTLTDEGRLKPIYSATVVAFSKPDEFGGRTYLVKEQFEFQRTKDGALTAQVHIRKKFLDDAKIRILTLRVDGRLQTAGAAYLDIPLKKFLKTTPVSSSPGAPLSVAEPPQPTIKK